MSSLVPLVEAVTRRELFAHRTLSLGVVTEVFTNAGGSGDHHLDVHVRLHGDEMVVQNVPVLTARIGLSAMPRVDDLVLVGFIDGDLNGAVVLGVIHDADTPSPDAEPDELVYEVPDDGGDRRLEILLPDGNRVTVRDDDVTVAMGSTTMTIEADGNITLEAGGDLVLKAKGAVQIEAGTSATVKAASELTLESWGTAKLKGASTTIAGMTWFSAC
jgi:phage baseplate assembly protein gpV